MVDFIHPNLSKNYMTYFVIWKDKAGQYRLTLKGGNNKIIFTTEGYINKLSAENAARLARSTNVLTKIKDLTKPVMRYTR